MPDCPRHATAALILATVLAGGCSDEEKKAAPETCEGNLSTRTLPNHIDTTFPIGPIVLHTTGTSTTIMWESEDPCSAELIYGPKGGSLSQTVPAAAKGPIYQATVNGLDPGTEYDYRARACDLETATLTFATAPPPKAPVRFAVIGDTQSHPETSSVAFASMKNHSPHFIMHAGDEVGDGSVRDQWRDEIFTPMRQLGHYVPYWSTIGNHEGNSQFYYDYSNNPYTGIFGEPARGAFYSFTFGTVFFLVVDTNNFLLGLAAYEESGVTDWIREQLASEAAKKASWRFAIGHHWAFTESWGHCDIEPRFQPIDEWLMPLLSEHDFHTYFAGHTHAYERGASTQGVTHIVSGGGGGDLDIWCWDVAEIEVTQYRHHYVIVDATCESLTLQAFDPADDSEPFDTVVINRD